MGQVIGWLQTRRETENYAVRSQIIHMIYMIGRQVPRYLGLQLGALTSVTIAGTHWG